MFIINYFNNNKGKKLNNPKSNFGTGFLTCIIIASLIVFSGVLEIQDAHAATVTAATSGDWNTESPSEEQVPGHSSNLVAHSDDCDSSCTLTLTPPIDLTLYSSANLKFWRYVDNDIDSGEYLKVELYDGINWNTVFNWTNGVGDDDDWHQETVNLDSYLGVSNFDIRIVTKQSSSSEDIEIDDVVIEGIP